MEGNWTRIGEHRSLIDVKKWKLDEASEKDDYCLCAEWFYHDKSDFLHGRNCTESENSDALEIGCVCEQKANLPHINDDYVWWTQDDE